MEGKLKALCSEIQLRNNKSNHYRVMMGPREIIQNEMDINMIIEKFHSNRKVFKYV